MKTVFNLTNGEHTDKVVYYFEDGSYLKLEIRDIDKKEMSTPFGYLIKVEEFTKDDKPVFHSYSDGYEHGCTSEVNYMRLQDIEEEYGIFFSNIESTQYV